MLQQNVIRKLLRDKLDALKLYNSFCRVTIFSVFLVICAGGFVRMTGSGMGCPDWPKCFGFWVPPLELSDLPYNYKEIYSEKGYDELDFNAFKTWTEYINRLLGLFSGILCFIILVISSFTRSNLLKFFTFCLVCLFAFQAWMGAMVVYSILAPFKITIHMLIALVILSILIFLYRISSVQSIKKINGFNKWIWLALSISIIQIILGTQVREAVDELLYDVNRSDIITQLPFVFEIHRTIAWLVVVVNMSLIYHYKYFFNLYAELKAIIFIILGLILTGILMAYFNFLAIGQLLHLILAVLLFFVQWSFLLKQSKIPNLTSP